MTGYEFIKIDMNKVRASSNLMTIYKELFKANFGKEPNCIGCSFSSDWKKLVTKIKSDDKTQFQTEKNKTMEKNFKLKRAEGKILTYKKENRPYRCYDNKLTDEFVNEFLANGTEEEIEERKKLFSVLPKEDMSTNSLKEYQGNAIENNKETIKKESRKKN